MTEGSLILAPLRGVTIRCFRETFAKEIAEAGFAETVTPFITANAGVDPLKDRELRVGSRGDATFLSRVKEVDSSFSRDRNVASPLEAVVNSSSRDRNVASPLVTPQFIGKDPAALRFCLERIKSAGYTTADLNCGCPFPMVRNKGRGSGILRTPDVLRQMLEVGCEVMGPGNFSIKARLGVERTDELLKLMPLVNAFPLRYLTIHARTARQMYEGACDLDAFRRIQDVAAVPLVYNGDLPFPLPSTSSLQPPTFNLQPLSLMLGRGFIRYLGTREDASELLRRYLAASVAELCGDRPVLGRMKELLSYWKELPRWSRRWNLIKICRTLDELRAVI